MKEEIIKSIHKYYLTLKKANDHNIELYNKKYKNNPDFRLWEDDTGYSHIIKKPSCVLCEYCADIWIDPLSTQIYYCECGIGMDSTKCKTCEKFEEVKSEKKST